MNLRSLLSMLTVCVSLASHTAHAVTCAANMSPSNPDAAYTPVGDGNTVTDTRTGLEWKRCSESQSWNGSTCTGTATTHTWAQALTLASTSSSANHSDWRLPNLKELRSLVEECRSSSAINDTIFPATPSSDFWPGSPYAGYSYYAWYVNFDADYASYHYNRSRLLGVRLVRGGQWGARAQPHQ